MLLGPNVSDVVLIEVFCSRTTCTTVLEQKYRILFLFLDQRMSVISRRKNLLVQKYIINLLLEWKYHFFLNVQIHGHQISYNIFVPII